MNGGQSDNVRRAATKILLPVFFVVSLSTVIADEPVTGDADASGSAKKAVAADRMEFFERFVRPILSNRCYECHSASAKTLHGGLRLDSSEGLKQGGDSGHVVIPQNPQDSLLIQVLTTQDTDIRMPPDGSLPEGEIELLKQWIRDGAIVPEIQPGDLVTRSDSGIDYESGRQFWSFQPLREVPLPDVADSNWPRRRLDYFVLKQLEASELKPSPQATTSALLRRMAFDLTGLPPSQQELQQWTAEDSDPEHSLDRYADRLIASPAFGERWARMWLDLARYTDRTASWLDATGEAWLYRDWVVSAMNDDMPYDEFVRRQLATDLYEHTGPDDLPALGFCGLSPTYWKELKLPAEIIRVIVADEWEERVDAVSRTFLGLTVACARCHDHKFDPISSEDYYALAGIFASCRIGARPVIAEEQYAPVRKARQRVAELKEQITKLNKQKPVPREQIDRITQQIREIETNTPFFDVPLATVVIDESTQVVRAGQRADQGTRIEYRTDPQDLPLFVRGNPNRPGPVVKRRFLKVLSPQDTKPFTHGSGRRELAEAITRDAAHLLARVMVNRIWAVYFGRGLVSTTSNFGRMGARPTHPHLLDDLAAGLIRNHWSLKWLHREIVTSATYRQSTHVDLREPRCRKATEKDPDNSLLWKMNRRRMDFEQWRDAMLCVSGQLNRMRGGPSVSLDRPDNTRRTLYATVHRREMSPVMLIHDIPAPIAHSPHRINTTTALQGLFALNSPMVQQFADRLAERILQQSRKEEDRIRFAYQLLFARSPTKEEINLGRSFLAAPDDEAAARRLQQYAHVLLISNEFLHLN